MVGGKERVPAIGFAIGVERLLLLLGESGEGGAAADVFLVTSGERFQDEAFRWKMDLIGKGVRADMDYEGRSVKAQFRRADRSGAGVVVIFGDAEDSRGAVVFRDMASGKQEEIPKDEAIRRLATLKKEE
jgi:histidyl-tRNA synthetase